MAKKDKELLKKIISEIKDSIVRVNKTLSDYQEDYISASRSGDVSNKEPCKSFSQYIEIRFNRECWKIPELLEAMDLTRGHLFTCREIVNEDSYSRRFDTVLVTVIDENDIENEIDKIISLDYQDVNLFRELYPNIVIELRDSLKRGIDVARSILNKYLNFKFNSVKQRIKLTDINNKVIK